MNELIIRVCILSSVLCTAGAVLCALPLMFEKKKYSSRKGLDSLIDYAVCADDKTFVLKNGALMCCYEILPLETGDLSDAVIAQCRSRFSKAIRLLSSGWAVHIDCIREKDPGYPMRSFAKHRTVLELESLRKQHAEADPFYRNRFYLTLTRKGDAKIRALMDVEVLLSGSMPSVCRKVLDDFYRELETIVREMSQCVSLVELKKSPDGQHPALSYIKSCICACPRSARAPAVPMYLDAVLGCSDLRLTDSEIIEVGRRKIICISIDDMPPKIMRNALGEICRLGCSLRFSSRFIAFSSGRSQWEFSRLKRLWQQRLHSFSSQITNTATQSNENPDAQNQITSITRAETALSEGSESFGSYSGTVIIGADDEDSLWRSVNRAQEIISKCGFNGRVELLNNLEAYIGSLPGQVFENLRKATVSSSMLSCLVPLEAPYTGSALSPNKGYGENAGALALVRSDTGGRMFLNLHVQDLGNTIVAGPPGSGKSVLLNFIITNLMRYRGMRIFAFEKGMSFYALTRIFSGVHISLSKPLDRLCPFEYLETEGDLEYARAFAERLFKSAGAHLSSELSVKIHEALMRMKRGSARSLTDFAVQLGDPGLKSQIDFYLSSEENSSVLDGYQNPALQDENLCVVEYGGSSEEKTATRELVLMQIFHLIERTLSCHDSDSLYKRPGAIIIDEAWLMLSDEDFRNMLTSWLKTMRKNNVLVIVCSQSLSDFTRTDISDTLRDCIKTQIFLPNPEAAYSDGAEEYEKFGLMPSQIEKIGAGLGKHDYFIKQNRHFEKFSLPLTSEEIVIYSLSGDRGRHLIDKALKAESLKENTLDKKASDDALSEPLSIKSLVQQLNLE